MKIKKWLNWFFDRKNLFIRVSFGFIAGIILGFAAPRFSIAVKVAGDVYLSLIKLMIIPTVVSAVFCGIASIQDMKMLRRVGFRTVILYVLMFIASAVVSLIIVYSVRPGRGFAIPVGTGFDKTLADTSVSGFLMRIIPSNIIAAASAGDTLSVILFTSVFAVAVVSLGKKAKPVSDFMNSLSEINFRILGYFMELSPIGVMSLMAYSVADYGSGIFGVLAKYIGCCWICCLAVLFVVMVFPVCVTCKISPAKLLKAMGRIALVTMSTTSSAATLPTTIRVSIDDLDAPEGISKFTLPLGCTINMCGGACSFCCLAVFTADIYGLDLSVGTVVCMVLVATLINMAAPGIPGGGVILGASFLSVFGLPFDVMAIISGFYRLLDMAFTTINVEGDVAANLLIAKSVGEYPANSSSNDK